MPEDESNLMDILNASIASRDPDDIVLTAKQRAYLRGQEPEIDQSTERERRRTIRNRFRSSFIDMAIAFEHLDAQDRAQLLLQRKGSASQMHPHGGEDAEPGPAELDWSYLAFDWEGEHAVLQTGGLRQTLSLVFLSLADALIDEGGWEEAQYQSFIEALVAGALRDAFAKRGEPSKISIAIDTEPFEDDIVEQSTEEELVQQRYSERTVGKSELLDCFGYGEDSQRR